jgi:2-phospho-L-lactate guanylyltransferase
VCVVPVKGSAGAKSRLGELPESFPARGELAEAFALDTVAALLSAPSVAQVLVVTADPAAAAPLRALGAQIVPEPPQPPPADAPNPANPADASSAPETSNSPAALNAPNATPGDPLNAAIAQGLRVAHERWPLSDVAVLTGDLPALTVADVERTLTQAATHDRAMVADEEGTGTTALLARAGFTVTPQFGAGSRAAHEAAGHHPLDLPASASIRRDVDTIANLADVLRRGVGAHTSAVISRSPSTFSAS